MSGRTFQSQAIFAVSAGLLAAMSTGAGAQSSFVDPAELDREIADFLGHAAGTTGGARATVDARLKLSRCASPFEFVWHGEPGRNLAVSCPEPAGWRIFIPIMAAPDKTARREPAVRPGDMLWVLLEGRGFAVQGQARAREAGVIGEWIKIELIEAHRPMMARIERPGLASIPLHQEMTPALAARP